MIYLYSIIEGLFFTDFFSHSRVSLIFAIELFLIYSNIKAYTNIIKYITTNLIIFLLNVILYIFPLDKIDGVLSIIKCYRIIDTYKKSKKIKSDIN